MILDLTVSDLIENTKSKKANPGGGAVLSLVGVFGINLILMLDNLSKYEDMDTKKIDQSRKKLQELSERLKNTVEEDVNCYSEVTKAKKIKDEEIRKHRLNEGYKIANRPPMQTVEILLEAMQYINPILSYGNINVLSDGRIGLNLMYEAIISSFYNIELNGRNIENFSYDFEKNYNLASSLKKQSEEIITGRYQW